MGADDFRWPISPGVPTDRSCIPGMEEKATLLNLRYSMLTLKLLLRRLLVFHWVGNLPDIPGLPESGKGPCRHFLKSILVPFPFSPFGKHLFAT